MPEQQDIDLRAAVNAISDVIQNRPRPLRVFDQIYMKAGDMVLQSEMVARWADGRQLAFIGDGDAISVCVAYLQHRGILNYGPSKITVFAQRGMEATGHRGDGLIVLADDLELAWPKKVLGNVQTFVLKSGFFVERMMPRLHSYHLDDSPELRSCNLLVRALPDNHASGTSAAITDPSRLKHFYGRDNSPRVRYVREKTRLDYGTAHEDEYYFDWI